MLQFSFLNSKIWEDSKVVSFLFFFFFLKVLNLMIVSSEKVNFMIIFLHLKTFLSLPLIFLFKNNWSMKVQYFFFQLLGSMMVEVGYSFYYFSSEWVILMGLFMKLGIFPFLWWFPVFVSSQKWFNFFFFNTLNKFPMIYILTLLWMENLFFILLSMLFLSAVNVYLHTDKFSGKKKIKYFLGWMSIMDTIFFVWLGMLKFQVFMSIFLMYCVLYMIMSLSFHHSMEKNISFLKYSLSSKIQNSNFFMVSVMIILFLMGFPPLLPFFMKFSLMKNIKYLESYFFMMVFFMFSLFQGLMYLKVFFSLLKKKKFFFFKKMAVLSLISWMGLLFFFFPFFLW